MTTNLPSYFPSDESSQTPLAFSSSAPANGRSYSPSDQSSLIPAIVSSKIPTNLPSYLTSDQTASVRLEFGGLRCDEEISEDVIVAIEDAVTVAIETEYVVRGVNITSFSNSFTCP